MVKKLVCSLILGSFAAPLAAHAGEGVSAGTLRKMLQLTWTEGRDWDGETPAPVPAFTFEYSERKCDNNLGFQTCVGRFTVKSSSGFFNGRIYEVRTFSRDIGQLEVESITRVKQ